MATGGFKDSVLLAGVGLLDKKFNSAELRRPPYNAFRAFLEKRGMLIPDHKALRLQENRVTQCKYFERDANPVVGARACVPTPTMSDTGTFNLSWETYARSVWTGLKIGGNNYYSEIELLSHSLYNAWMDLYDQIETDCITYLEANRTGLQGNRDLNTWDGVNDVMVVAAADRDNYLNYINVEAKADYYNGSLQDIHHINLMAMYRQQYSQGISNDENLKFQFAGADQPAIYTLPGFKHYWTNYVTNGSDHFGTSYIVEEGLIAALDWIPETNRRGIQAKTGSSWYTVRDPFMGLEWAVYSYDGCLDTSFATLGGGVAPQGAPQDYVRIFEISLDLSLNHAPLTVANQTPIMKYALAAT